MAGEVGALFKQTGASYSVKCDMCNRFLQIRGHKVHIWDIHYHTDKSGRVVGRPPSSQVRGSSLPSERVSVCEECNPLFTHVYSECSNLKYLGKHGYEKADSAAV